MIWGCAVMGVIYKGFFFGKYEKVSLAIYLIMGWLCLIAAKEIVANITIKNVLNQVFCDVSVSFIILILT